jgi:hypothetical protein
MIGLEWVLATSQTGGIRMSEHQNERDRAFYWEWLLHEEDILTARSNFFLVAEAMFFAAVASLSPPGDIYIRFSVLVLCAAGFLVTLVWLYVNAKHLALTGEQIRIRIRGLDPRVDELRAYTGVWKVRSHHLIGYAVPILMLIVWACWGYAWLKSTG